MVEQDLCSYDLIECIIESEDGAANWSEHKRRKLKSRALTYISASIHKSIAVSIEKELSAFSAFQKLTADYGENATHDEMDLFDRLINLHFYDGH